MPWKDNAFSRRDYWILLPVAVLLIMWLMYLPSCNGLVECVGATAAVVLGAGILSFAVFYSHWAIWVIPGFFIAELLNIGVEYVSCGTSCETGTIVMMASLGLLSCVVVIRRIQEKKSSSAGS